MSFVSVLLVVWVVSSTGTHVSSASANVSGTWAGTCVTTISVSSKSVLSAASAAVGSPPTLLFNSVR